MEEAIERVTLWIEKGDPSRTLDFSFLSINELPNIPDGVKVLICYGTGLRNLPENLPDSLTHLCCAANHLIRLPILPPRLEHLSCTSNNLVELPILPTSLLNLWCDSNELETLPSLPQSLWILSCAKNRLRSLPVLPPNLKKLNCSNNDIAELPDLPESLSALDFGNNLECCDEIRSRQQRARVISRCRQIKEELMMNCWSPWRVERLLEAGMLDELI
jgi:Leucine-rich repeat (LRR) protein